MRPARSTLLRLPAAAVIAAIAFSGCGGSQVSYQQVPGDPADVTLPHSSTVGADAPADASASPDAASADGSATATPTPTATATATPEAGAGDATGAATDGTATGADTATGTADGVTTDQPPAPGSDSQRFEDFCAQNPGAC